MNKISAKIIADSVDKRGNRITTFLLTFPRFILPELNTHRMFSRNSASSRAIPFEKMVKMVEEDPFIPIAWQKNHKGMQGSEYITNVDHISECRADWVLAKDNTIEIARRLSEGFPDYKSSIENEIIPRVNCVTKQIVNRLLEPFMWHTVLVTATEFSNFFELRLPKYTFYHNYDGIEIQATYNSWKEVTEYYNDKYNWALLDRLKVNESQAEIHIQALAESMWDCYNESKPKELKEDEWHVPFGDSFDKKEIDKFAWITNKSRNLSPVETELAIAVARCARLSYMTFDGEIDYKKDLELFDRLLESRHLSPFEHVARCMSNLEYYSFIKGKYPTGVDQWGIFNYEHYPFKYKEMFEGENYEFVGPNPKNPNIFGWCNNFRGFIPYRYLLENNK